MTKKGETIHGAWMAMVAFNRVLGRMTPHKAEKKALDSLVEIYGEEAIRKELEIENNGNPLEPHALRGRT